MAYFYKIMPSAIHRQLCLHHRFFISNEATIKLIQPWAVIKRCISDVLVLIIALAPAIPVFAQMKVVDDDGFSKTRIGITGGIVITSFKMADQPGTSRSSLLRLRAGLFTHTPISEDVAFRTELTLTGKGSKFETTFPIRDKLTYLELPLNLLYQIKLSKGKFYIGGGPAPAFLLNENFYSRYSSSSAKKFDVGINALATYERPIGFSVNIHYTYGLLNISKFSAVDPNVKNRCLGISMGYLF